MWRKASWSLPIAFGLLIFWMSHQSVLPMNASIERPWDKVAHFFIYATLAGALEWAWRTARRDVPLYRRHLWVFLLVSLFGCLDEVHQSFVPGRDVEILDGVVDSLGAAFGLMVLSLPFLWTRHLKPFSWWRGEQKRPDPGRVLVLVADPHWKHDLTHLDALTARHKDADWLFLGDLFEVWIGGIEQPVHGDFLEWVKQRRAAGAWVGLWMGNREFFLDGHSEVFSLLGEGVGGALPGEGLRFEHGDLINAQDHAYRLWNLVIRSGPVWLLTRLLPKDWAQRLSEKAEKALGETNLTYKAKFPTEAFRAAAEGDGCLVTGHFHRLEREGKGVSLPFAKEGAYMVWREGRLEERRVP